MIKTLIAALFLLTGYAQLMSQYPFKKEGKWGYINDSLQTVQPASLDEAGFFNGQYAIVSKEKKHYLINRQFEKVSQSYDSLWLINQQVFVGLDKGTYSVCSPTCFKIEGLQKKPYSYHEFIWLEKNGKNGITDTTGKLIVPIEMKGIAIADSGFLVTKNNLMGYVGFSGQTILPTTFDQIYHQDENHVVAVKGGLKGLYSAGGVELTPCEWDEVFWLCRHYLEVKKDGKKLLYNYKEKKLVSGESFEKYIIEGNTINVYNPGGIGLLDSLGKLIVPTKYHEIYRLNDSLYYIWRNNRLGIYNILKGEIVPPSYRSITIYNGFCIADSTNKKQALFTNTLGKMVPAKYDLLRPRLDGVIISQEGRKLGIIDSKGNEIFTPEFDEVGPLSNNVLMVRKDLFWGVVNLKGERSEISFTQFNVFSDMVKLYNEDGLTILYTDGDAFEFEEYPGMKTVFLTPLVKTPDPQEPISRDSLEKKKVNQVSYTVWYFDARMGKYGRRDEKLKAVSMIPKFDGYKSVPGIEAELTWIDIAPTKVIVDGIEMICTRKYGLVDKALDLEVLNTDLLYFKLIDMNGMSFLFGLRANGDKVLVNRYGRVVLSGVSIIEKINHDVLKVAIGGDVVSSGVSRHFAKDYFSHRTYGVPFSSNDELKSLIQSKNCVEVKNATWYLIRSAQSDKLFFNGGKEVFTSELLFGNRDEKGLISVKNNRKEELIRGRHENIRLFTDPDTLIVVTDQSKKYGLINNEGQLLVTNGYDQIELPSNGMVMYEKKGLTGFINLEKRLEHEPRFLKAQSFSEDKAAVLQLGGWGFVDNNMDLVIGGEYKSVRSFSEEKAAVQLNDTWGFIDHNGNWLIEPKFDRVITDFDQGYAAVIHNGKKGVIGVDGRFAVLPMYKNIRALGNGNLIVQTENKDGIFFSANGKMIHPKYDKVNALGHFVVGIKGESKEVYFKGERIFADKKVKVYEGNDEVLIVVDKAKSYLYNSKGEIIGEPITGKVVAHFEEGHVLKKKGKFFIVYNGQEREVQGEWSQSQFGHHLFEISRGVFNCYDKLGSLLLENITGFIAIDFNKSYYQKHEKWFVLDQGNNHRQEVPGDQVDQADKNYAVIHRNNSQGVLNHVGQKMIPCEYQEVIPVSKELFFVRQNEFVGYLNRFGEEVIPLSN